MKLNWIIGGALALSVVSCGNEKDETEAKETVREVAVLTTEIDSISYALGVNISEGFTAQKVLGISSEKMAKGFNDFLSGSATMSEAECMNVLQGFMMKHQEKMQDTLNSTPYRQATLDSLSYALGVNVSESFKKQGVEGLNGTLLSQGFSDYSNKTSQIDGTASLVLLQGFMTKQQALKAKPMIEEGEKFLAENGTRPEVVTLESGLQYEIIKKGNGKVPTMMDKVSTHYHGTLLDGTVFDSSIERGEPIEFGVGGVIKGWTEALQLMPVGSKWKLYIPHYLAYGEMGSPPKIAPYSTLIFDIELISIVK